MLPLAQKVEKLKKDRQQEGTWLMRAKMVTVLAILSACAFGGVMLASTGVAQASGDTYGKFTFSDEYGDMWENSGVFSASTTNNTPLTGYIAGSVAESTMWELPNGECMAFNNNGIKGSNDGSLTLADLKKGYIDEAACNTNSVAEWWIMTENSNGTETFENSYVIANYSPDCDSGAYNYANLGASDGSNSELSMNCPSASGEPTAGQSWSH